MPPVGSSNHIDNMEHDRDFRVKKVSVFNDDGAGNLVRQGVVATEAKQDAIVAAIEAIPTSDVSTVVTAIGDTAKYALYATEYGATYNYIAKEDASGAWFIQRETISSGVRQYVAGASDVATAWTNRVSQTYGLYSAAF